MGFFRRLFRMSAAERTPISRPVAEARAGAERSPQLSSPKTPPPPPTGPTVYCDICGATVQSTDLTVMPLRQMQQAVRDGFNPFDAPGIDTSRSLAVGRAGGLSAGQLFAEWRQNLMQDSTDWQLCRHCLTGFQQVTRESSATTAAPERVTAKPRAAKATEHYMLECIECDFTHHIPRDNVDSTVNYSVDVDRVKMACVYGPAGRPRQFTVTLEVKDFFRITPVPESGRVLHASIRDNMKPLHRHMLSHCDPLFLIIKQSSNQTVHQYKKRPEGKTFVKFSREHGVDIVGNIDLPKAEIPGVSD